jgi:hypothetical protein
MVVGSGYGPELLEWMELDERWLSSLNFDGNLCKSDKSVEG